MTILAMIAWVLMDGAKHERAAHQDWRSEDDNLHQILLQRALPAQVSVLKRPDADKLPYTFPVTH